MSTDLLRQSTCAINMIAIQSFGASLRTRHLTVRGTIEDDGNYYYYHDVEADRPVDIRFIGSDEERRN